MANKNLEEVFDNYINALEQDEIDALDTVFNEKIQLKTSHLGNIKGINGAKKMLKWQGTEVDIRKIRIFNNVIRTQNNRAQQSVFILYLLGKEINGFMHHFQCGFLNAIKYEKEKSQWKMVSIHSNMVYETGNTSFVANWWQLIDYSLYNGSSNQTIHPFYDSPWLLETAGDLAEEDLLKQCFWHYNWLIDMTDFSGLEKITTDNCYDKSTQNSRNEWINWLRAKRPKEVVWSHITHFEELIVDGDKATATIFRYEPNRIGTKFLHKYNLYSMFYSGTWNIGFVKIDDQWKMDSFSFNPGMIEVSDQKGTRYF